MKVDFQQLSPERFFPSPDHGLCQTQVKDRFEHGLNNNVKQKYSKSYLSIFVNNICTFFNLLGLIVFVALLLVNAKLSNYFFILFFVANTTIGIVQEIRAKRCIDRLSLLTPHTTKAIRNGQTVEINTENIVLDDVLLLGIGCQIPTDCKILEGDIEVNESLLTGESVAIKKHPGDNLFAGSFITSGICKVQAIKVGKDNYVEQLSAKAKKYKKPHSEIMSALRIIIKIVGFVMIPIAVALVLKSLFISKGDLLEKFPEAVLTTATVIVGMIPSGMFLLTSLALAVGIIKLSKHNTLVQDLYSLEMLARVDTVCFDKTGTITDGNMTVKSVEIIDNNEKSDITTIISSMLGALKDNNQTAQALINHFGNEQKIEFKFTLPFNSARKLSAVTFTNGKTYAFGAPEFVLNKEKYSQLKEKIDKYAAEGLRVLVFAKSNKELAEDFIPNDFSPVSLILIVDNIREDAIDTINWFKQNDVAIKVISGDNPITVSEVSKRVGIDGAENYISLEGLSEQEVLDVANKYTVFGRVSPEQKALLVKALKAAGHVTAMTGDGVNDILALKESDCAISVAAGSDAARNVSHLVLTDNNFNSLPKVVYEGRRVINNVQCSASLFLMKTLFTMIMATISLILPYMTAYPFLPSQMNMLEFFVIGIPAFCLSLQPNDSRIQGKFINYVIKKSLPSALLMIFNVIVIEIIKKAWGLFDDNIYVNMQVFAILVAGVINLFIVCKPLNKYRSVLFFVSAFLVIMVILFAIFNVIPFINGFFKYTAMIPFGNYWHHILIIFGTAVIDVPLAVLLQKLFKNFNLPAFKKSSK